MAIKEVIIVEGRDDTAAVRRALPADTIETHGFGIREATWKLIEKAYLERGIIIFTDPDYSGEEIRKKLTAKFPGAKQAHLSRSEASRNGDIGIENADAESIRLALEKAHYIEEKKEKTFTLEDLRKNGLTGEPGSAKKRDKLGSALGIGYGNTGSFLNKLNDYNISREEFNKNISEENE